MTSEVPNREARGGAKESPDGGPWFATFSLLDAGCAIDSSQMHHLVASVTKLWRTIGIVLRRCAAQSAR
jgi:hypothetical protein